MSEQKKITVRGVPIAGTVRTLCDRIMAWVHDDGRIFIAALSEYTDVFELEEHIAGSFLFHSRFRYASTVYNCNEGNQYDIDDFFDFFADEEDEEIKPPVPDWAYRKLDAYVHSGCCISEAGHGTQDSWDTSHNVGVWYLSTDLIHYAETSLLQEARANCEAEGKVVSDEDLLHDIAQRYFEDDLKWKNADFLYEVNIIEFSPNGEEQESYWTNVCTWEDVYEDKSFAALFYDSLVNSVQVKIPMDKGEFVAFVTNAPDVIIEDV